MRRPLPEPPNQPWSPIVSLLVLILSFSTGLSGRSAAFPMTSDNMDFRPAICTLSLANVPPDLTLSCEGYATYQSPVTISASVDCCLPVQLTLTRDTMPAGPCPVVMTVTMTWTATDNCGESVSEVRLFTITDESAPVFVLVPDDLTVQCDDVPPPPVPGAGIIATDGCGGNVTIQLSESQIPGICPSTYQLLRTWTASDPCGHTATAVQTIHVVDTEAPQFVDPPANLTIACNVVPDPAPNLAVSDNCASTFEKTYTETMTGGGDCDLTYIYRTWTAEDQCGNANVYTQTITRGDTSPPVWLTVPPSVTVECDEVPDTQPTAQDDCDPNPEITLQIQTTPGSCPGQYTLVKTWTATDACGKSITASQTIEVIDTTGPAITFDHPAFINLQSGDTMKVVCQASEIFNAQTAKVLDNCDPNPTVEFIDSLIFDDGCKKLLYCAWHAIDHCQNESLFEFYMLVGDFSAPVLVNVPSDLTISCELPVPAPGTPTATDDCDLGPKITFAETTQSGPCPQSYLVIRTWTATDNCGNSSSRSQTITVRDIQPPVIHPVHPKLVGLPNGSILFAECGHEPVFKVSDITAEDLCDPEADIDLDILTEESDCQSSGYLRSVTYTWVASDDCGNTASYKVIVRITDTQPPVWTFFPPDLTIECGDPLPQTAPEAFDSCGTVAVLHKDTQVPLPCGYRIDRIWTARDACGNLVTGLQKIRVLDTQPPVLGQIPSDLTLACGTQAPMPPDVTAEDACDAQPSVSLNESDLPGACDGESILVRTWIATDACGNSVTKSQTITFLDTVPPVFTVLPADGTVSCDQVPDGQGQVQAKDDCSSTVTITWTDTKVAGTCPQNFFLVRVFVAVDGCGNTSEHVQKLSVQDLEPPVFGPIEDSLMIECDQVDNLPPPPVADNCDPSVILVPELFPGAPGNCPQEYPLSVIWTATDHCGNTSTAHQVFLVKDTQGPVIVPVNPAIANVPNGGTITVECDQVPVMTTLDVQVTDACDSVQSVTFSETVVFGDCLLDGFLYELTCTWTATDLCGNISHYTLYVRVVDSTAPVMSGVPPDVTVDVKNGKPIPDPAIVLASDACDQDPVISFQETTLPDTCGYTIIRIWTASDHCGNSATAEQVLYIDEGCPCQKPVVANLHIQQPSFGQANGIVIIDLLQDESGYTFQWIPNLGVPNTIGNMRTQLPPNSYQVFIKDKDAGPSCFIKVNIQLTNTWTNVDTIHVTIPQDDPSEICVDAVLDFLPPVAGASLCGSDPGALASIDLDPSSACLTVTPVKDWTGLTELCVIHCDNNLPVLCDTTYIFITVVPNEPPPCQSWLPQEIQTLDVANCGDLAEFCLPLAPDQWTGLTLTMDGSPFNPPTEGCDDREVWTFPLDLIPDNGQNGPYTLTWTIGNVQYSGGFHDLNELLVLILSWDPAGEWRLRTSPWRLTGGSPLSQYGSMDIQQPSTGIHVALDPEWLSLPHGSLISLNEGDHLFRIVDQDTGCKDEQFYSVNCLEQEEKLIAVDDHILTNRNQSRLINVLENDIIPGQVEDFYILKWPTFGSVSIVDNFKVLYQPATDSCVAQQFDYVVCIANQCDTATVWIDFQCNPLIFYTGFSPNGDGMNDRFTIEGIEAYPDNTLIIMNRWGNQVYRQKGYKNQWRGTWDDAELPDGTYFYQLDDGTGAIYSGYVQINR